MEPRDLDAVTPKSIKRSASSGHQRVIRQAARETWSVRDYTAHCSAMLVSNAAMKGGAANSASSSCSISYPMVETCLDLSRGSITPRRHSLTVCRGKEMRLCALEYRLQSVVFETRSFSSSRWPIVRFKRQETMEAQTDTHTQASKESGSKIRHSSSLSYNHMPRQLWL